MNNKAVATFAIGKSYQDYALTLADSFFFFNCSNEIKFYIITNSAITLDKKYQSRINIILDKNLLCGEDVLLNKIYIDEYIEEESIILIDADSLICKSLIPLFYLFRNENFGIWGHKKQINDFWKGNLVELFKQHEIDHLYGINGCLYYFKKNEQTKPFFQLCKIIINSYDDNGLPRVYNNLKDDEIAISLACRKLEIPILPYDSKIKAEKMYYARTHLNLYFGKCKLFYSNFEFEQNNILLENEANPIIFCLDRSSTSQLDYRLTAPSLRLFLASNIFLRVIIALSYTLVINIYYTIKYAKWDIANLNKPSKD